MGQPVNQDIFEQQAEQGQTPAPAVKPLSVTSKPAPLPVKVPPRPTPIPRPAAGLDWLERGFSRQGIGGDQAKKAKEAEEEKQRREQLLRLKAMDKKQSQRMYEEIQRQIQLYRRKKKLEPGKYVTGAAGYDPRQHQDPETFWDKVKKKQAEAKKKLPWTSKQGMGTGEITRGVSG